MLYFPDNLFSKEQKAWYYEQRKEDHKHTRILLPRTLKKPGMVLCFCIFD